MWSWECPSSLVTQDLWELVDLFWLCYSRVQGFSGWGLQQIALPGPGTPLEQDNRTMWALKTLEMAFYILQNDLQQESVHARSLEASHRQAQANR